MVNLSFTPIFSHFHNEEIKNKRGQHMALYDNHISNTDIGAKVRKRRLLLGWSASILGKKTGLSQQQISRYERGTQNFTISRLCIFANVLQCDLNYFLERRNQSMTINL